MVEVESDEHSRSVHPVAGVRLDRLDEPGGDERPSLDKLRPYYDDLIAEFFPGKLAW